MWVAGQDLLASAGDDGTVRIWDPATGTQLRQLSGHTGLVLGLCAVRVAGQDLLASAGDDGTVRIWDPATDISVPRPPRRWFRCRTAHTGRVFGLCAVRVEGQDLLASAGDDLTVRIWDPTTGTELRELASHARGVNGLCAVRIEGRDLLASAGDDGTVRIWDPATGTKLRRLTGHGGRVNGLCAVRVEGHDLLASAGVDLTVRIWDPTTGTEIARVPTYANATTVVAIATQVVVGLDTGLLAIELSPNIGKTP